MSIIPSSASVTVARQALKLRKHSPVLMFGAGVVTAAASTVFACKATLKVEEVLNETEKKKLDIDYARDTAPEKYSDKDRSQDLVKLRVQTAVNLGKLYAPAIGLGVLSIGLLTGSHVVLSKRNVALTAAYSALEKGFNEYRARVRDELGEDKEREFRYGVIQKEIVEEGENGHEVKTVTRIDGSPRGSSIYARVFDELNPNWKPMPEYNRLFLQAQQAYANNQLQSRGHVFLNDVYDSLKMPRSKEGSVVGWLKGHGDDFVDFGLFDDDNQVKDFMRGEEGAVWLDFNVVGNIWDKI